METTNRWLAGVLAAYYASTGVFMLFFGSAFHALPMVAQTGPFNSHFVRDVGAAFLASAFGLAARSWRSRYRSAAAVGALVVVLHAVIHLVELAKGMDAFATQTLVAIVAPAALAVLVAIPCGGPSHA